MQRVDTISKTTGTQIPHFIQANVTALAGLSEDKVTVHALCMGDSFGHRLEGDVVKHATELAVQMQGTRSN